MGGDQPHHRPLPADCQDGHHQPGWLLDWFAYTNGDLATKSGVQITAIAKIVTRLSGWNQR